MTIVVIGALRVKREYPDNISASNEYPQYMFLLRNNENINFD